MSNLEPCPVCEAVGGWSKKSGVPYSNREGDKDDNWMRCPFCKGERKVVIDHNPKGKLG